jgi:6-phosphofructokinase 1
VVIAVCEGQLDDRGQPFGADVDRPGSARHQLASNLGHSLARLISQGLGIRARSEKPGVLGRSNGPLASELDRTEARECGVAAVAAAKRGESGVMIGLRRESGEMYHCTTFSIFLTSVGGGVRSLPQEWISPGGNDSLPAFRDYAAPCRAPASLSPLFQTMRTSVLLLYLISGRH